MGNLFGAFAIHNSESCGEQFYLEQNELSSRLKGKKLTEIMNQPFIAVKLDLKISDLISNYFNIYWKSAFPVIHEDNHLEGMITTESVFKKKK